MKSSKLFFKLIIFLLIFFPASIPVGASLPSASISADVPDALTFSITGVASGQTFCNKITSVSTTATTIPFSNIGFGSFFNASHQLSVSTNAANGYSVAVKESNPLSIDGLGKIILPDIAPTDWTSNSDSGFGYSLQNSSGNDATFQYNDSSRTFSAKPFDSTSAMIIMKNSGPVNESVVNICYQIATSVTQTSGNYLNQLTYIATPTF